VSHFCIYRIDTLEKMLLYHKKKATVERTVAVAGIQDKPNDRQAHSEKAKQHHRFQRQPA